MLIQRILKVNVQLRIHPWRCQKCFISNLKVLYFGTDNFSLPSLKLLSEEKLSRLEVVTSFKATKNPVKAFADSKAIKIHDWAVLSKEENFHLCQEFDLGLVVSFGHLIPERIINCFKNGMLNVHASLLPKYRGASPIIYALRNGDNKTGVSIMRIQPRKFDIGEVLTTREIPISNEILMPELHEQLASLGAELLVECIQDLDKYQPIEQDNSLASYAPKISNEFCEVRWKDMPATEIFNLYRSVYSFRHITTTFNKELAKLIEVHRTQTGTIDASLKNCQPGQLYYCKKSRKLLVKCADENFLEIKQLSIGRKKMKVMSAADFNNGFLKKCDKSERHFE